MGATTSVWHIALKLFYPLALMTSLIVSLQITGFYSLFFSNHSLIHLYPSPPLVRQPFLPTLSFHHTPQLPVLAYLPQPRIAYIPDSPPLANTCLSFLHTHISILLLLWSIPSLSFFLLLPMLVALASESRYTFYYISTFVSFRSFSLFPSILLFFAWGYFYFLNWKKDNI